MASLERADRDPMHTADDEIGECDALQGRCFLEELLLFAGFESFVGCGTGRYTPLSSRRARSHAVASLGRVPLLALGGGAT